MALSRELARQLHLAPGLTDRFSRGEKKELPLELLPEANADEPSEELDVWVHSQFYVKGGQKKKALSALSKHKEGSVHEITELQQTLR